MSLFVISWVVGMLNPNNVGPNHIKHFSET